MTTKPVSSEDFVDELAKDTRNKMQTRNSNRLAPEDSKRSAFDNATAGTQDTRVKTTEVPHAKVYDLSARTLAFARNVRDLIIRLPRSIANHEDSRQLIRSSGAIGANYLEANDALGKKDFLHRIKISRKEAKESRYWLRLLECEPDSAVERDRARLAMEAGELIKILSAIASKAAA